MEVGKSFAYLKWDSKSFPSLLAGGSWYHVKRCKGEGMFQRPFDQSAKPPTRLVPHERRHPVI